MPGHRVPHCFWDWSTIINDSQDKQTKHVLLVFETSNFQNHLKWYNRWAIEPATKTRRKLLGDSHSQLHNCDAQPVWFQSLEYWESVQLLLTWEVCACWVPTYLHMHYVYIVPTCVKRGHLICVTRGKCGCLLSSVCTANWRRENV